MRVSRVSAGGLRLSPAWGLADPCRPVEEAAPVAELRPVHVTAPHSQRQVMCRPQAAPLAGAPPQVRMTAAATAYLGLWDFWN